MYVRTERALRPRDYQRQRRRDTIIILHYSKGRSLDCIYGALNEYQQVVLPLTSNITHRIL